MQMLTVGTCLVTIAVVAFFTTTALEVEEQGIRASRDNVFPTVKPPLKNQKIWIVWARGAYVLLHVKNLGSERSPSHKLRAELDSHAPQRLQIVYRDKDLV
jgi:hypothetical protein